MADDNPEEWRPVPGHPDYKVSSLGRVMSLKRKVPRLLSTGPVVESDEGGAAGAAVVVAPLGLAEHVDEVVVGDGECGVVAEVAGGGA